MNRDSVDLAHLFLDAVPLMDVRAPIEFLKGAFPGTVNLPLMNDAERQQVGTCYKQRGQEAAIALGHKLVSGDTKAARIAAWVQFAKANPHGMLYCARGGLRSQISQQWLEAEVGIAYPRVPGGYKALRTYLLNATAQLAADDGFVVLSGLTGSGKTELLQRLANGIDLEGHARHRGSSFGAYLDAQPSPISFENALAIDFIQRRAAGHRHWVLEDEGRCIGACPVPLPLRHRMETAPIVWLDEPFEQRVERILQEYVIDLRRACESRWGEDAGFEAFAQRLRHSMTKIHNRLGGERHQRLLATLNSALQTAAPEDALAQHRAWIARLLREYYDPMYRFQKDSHASRIVFSGERPEVLAHLQARANRL